MQHGDEGRAREWMARALSARRDPAWTADGFVSERWLPVSPVTGRLDAFEWKDPLSGEEPARALIEAERNSGAFHANAETARVSGSADSATSEGRGQAESTEPLKPTKRQVSGVQRTRGSVELPAALPGSLHKLDRPRPTLAPIPLAPGVIPLVHAPDDPGPEPEAPGETESDTNDDERVANWTRIRHFFRP
jgi:HemY protein